MKVFLSFSAILFLTGVAFAAPAEPKGSVVCEVPEGATTALGTSYGTVRARVKTDASFARVKVDLNEKGSNEDTPLLCDL